MQALQCPTPQGTTKSSQTYQNNNWYYAGTAEAWLHTDYTKPPYNICSFASTTAYKLPQYTEDLDCYNCKNPKTNAEILDELKALDPEWIIEF